MGDDMTAGMAPFQASEQIDGKIAEIESLLMTLALAHRNAAMRMQDREAVGAERH